MNRTINANELILNSLWLPVSVQGSGTEIKFTGFEKNYNGISGSIGLSYLVDKKSTLKFNLSRGFRAAKVAELGSNGRHEGPFRYELGNPDLKSEQSHQIDLGYFYNSDHVSYELTPFTNIISNYIFIEKSMDGFGNNIIIDSTDSAPVFKYTQGNANLIGGEIYLDVHPHPFDWLHFENSLPMVRAIQNNQPDSTKYLPFIPAPKYRGELKAQFKKIGKGFMNTYIKFGIDYFFQRYQVFSVYFTESRTPAYTLLNTGLGTDIKHFIETTL